MIQPRILSGGAIKGLSMTGKFSAGVFAISCFLIGIGSSAAADAGENSANPLPAECMTEGIECSVIEQNPLSPQAKRIEVVEAFSYGCGHCYRMEPQLNQWLTSKPEHVQFRRLHTGSQGANRSFAKFYYTLERLGRMDLHESVFKAVFEEGRQLTAGDEEEAFTLQMAFASEHGIDPGEFSRAYRSPAVVQAMQAARERLRAYQVIYTPTLVVGGRYRILMTRKDRQAEVFAAVDGVVRQLDKAGSLP